MASQDDNLNEFLTTDAHCAGKAKIRNCLADAGNHGATAGARLTSPFVLSFGLAKVAWDSWPLLLAPFGLILGVAAGVVLGIGIGGCGIVWNVCGIAAEVVAAAWHTAQQGIAALVISDNSAAAAAAAAGTTDVSAPHTAGSAETSTPEVDAGDGKEELESGV